MYKMSKIYIIFIFFFYTILSENVEYESMTIDEFTTLINKKELKEEEYKLIIDSLIGALKTYYVYLDISKEPQIPIEKVDLIKRLEAINLKNITYLGFYNQVQSIIYLVKDGHLNVRFLKLRDFIYCIPFGFYVDTKGIIRIGAVNNYQKYFDKEIINKISSYYGLEVIKINNYDPDDFIIHFPVQNLKDEHAQFSFNIDRIHIHTIDTPFYPEKYKNLTIEFKNNKNLSISYKVLYPKLLSKEFKSFYDNEIELHKYDIFEPSIYEIEKKFLMSKSKENNLEQMKWDLNYEDIIKYKKDNVNKMNIIVQSSFYIINFFSSRKFFGQLMEELSNNEYPIILIQNKNGGGIILFSSVLQKVLNYKSAMVKAIMTYKINDFNKKIISNQISFDIESCSYQSPNSDGKIYTDDFGNGIKHNRTQFFSLMNTYLMVDLLIKGKKYRERKPTEIIIFTDGYSFSTTSFFIKDLQESGNGIIVGYNGIPTQKRRNQKFNGSQSPSSVLDLSQLFPNDKNIINLKKYNITMRATFGASYDYSYQDHNKTFHIPREYTINLIDERSNIYGKYNDNRLNEFINEAKRIFEKYKEKCNPDNLNLLLKNDNCIYGGYLCNKNGTWSNICKQYYCEEGYQFDTFKKTCRKDKCYGKFVKYIVILIIIFILFLAILIISIVCCCKHCKCCKCCHCCDCCKEKDKINDEDINDGPLISFSDSSY